MGEIRAFSTRQRWTPYEEAVLLVLYANGDWGTILSLLPGRQQRTVNCKANLMGLKRVLPPKRTPDEVRKAKREDMARRWAADPEAARAKQRAWIDANREQFNAKRRVWDKSRIFYMRAKRYTGVSAAELSRLWKAQRGRCALTGDRLDRSAELDHKLPRARGGKNDLPNLQWVTATANRAKRDLTDDEFIALCRRVLDRAASPATASSRP